MKSLLAASVLVASATLPLFAEEAGQALVVEVPETWKVEFKGDKRIQFYTVKRKEGDPALLMFSRSPVPGNVNQIPEQIAGIAEGFVAQAKDHKDFKLKSDKFNIEEINGETFSGRFVLFEIEGGISQTMFMVGDEEEIWSGQFTGTKERWAEALEILKTLKKKAQAAGG